MPDQQITCSDCGDAFVFTQAEQSFYAEKGLSTAPKRCKACRAARKLSQGDRGSSDRGSSDRGSPGRGSGERGGNRFAPSNGRSGGGGGGGSEGGWRPRSPAGAPGGGSGGGSAGGWDRPRPSDRGAPRGAGPRPRVEEVQSRAPRDGAPPRRGNHHASDEARPARAAEPGKKAPAAARAPKPKFDITCAECGTTSQVPFKPLEGRQVFCQPCYRARKGTTETAIAGSEVAEADGGIVE